MAGASRSSQRSSATEDLYDAWEFVDCGTEAWPVKEALSPDYARNVIKDIRYRLCDAGVPGLVSGDGTATGRTDLRLALARWAIEWGAVTAADLADLPPRTAAGKGAASSAPEGYAENCGSSMGARRGFLAHRAPAAETASPAGCQLAKPDAAEGVTGRGDDPEVPTAAVGPMVGLRADTTAPRAPLGVARCVRAAGRQLPRAVGAPLGVQLMTAGHRDTGRRHR